MDPRTRINRKPARWQTGRCGPDDPFRPGACRSQHAWLVRPLHPSHDWGGRRRVLLVILDGWGIGKEDDDNPIFLAQTPVWDELIQLPSAARLQASGEAVGLQAGKAGNSEAGHMNIGAGRVVLQDDVRLDLAMQDGSFYHQ